MSNMGNYAERYCSFSWDQAAADLGWRPGDPINIGDYCSDRICRLGKGGKTALIAQDCSGNVRTYTFADLSRLSGNLASWLTAQGVQAGERVCLFMDRIPELYIAFLAVLKMGAVVQPLFSAFGPDALQTRLADAATTVILTQRKYLGKVRGILSTLPALRRVVVVDDEGGRPLQEGECAMHLDKLPNVPFTPASTTAESPSVLHYTSGTTGKPKGALHVHSSIVAQFITTRYVLDLTDSDVYWCTADPGWVTGTSYGIIGPWCCGVTQCVLDSGFKADIWYGFIERHGVTVWYTAPTAVRALMKEGEPAVRRANLSSLRHLCSVGEPLNAEAVIWAQRVYGRPFHDTYWQTETGCIVIANYPGMHIKPGSMGKPFPGIVATVIDGVGGDTLSTPNSVGLIAIRPGWPSMMRAYWNNEAAYRGKFQHGWYIPGDRAYIDENGYFWFVGRDDDVINTAGHLVGPFEIESALLEHPAVAESAAVGKPDPVNMEVVKVFITLKPGFTASHELELEIMNFVRKRLSALAMPQEVEFVSLLPKTRSGKIMRRVLRAREWGQEIGDISTLEND